MKPEITAKLVHARKQLAAAGGQSPQDLHDGNLLKGIDQLLAGANPVPSKERKPKVRPADAYQIDREVIIPKSEQEQLRVTRVIYRDREFINLRLWYCDRSTEAFLPSRKGLTLEIGQREALIEALKALAK